jgi:hypothetical protein
MKTAVSLPERVYREAEGYAKRTRKSRSQLYAEAFLRAAGGAAGAQERRVVSDLPEPAGSGPGFRRPVVVVQGNRSLLTERVGRLGSKPRAQILHGVDVVLGR